MKRFTLFYSCKAPELFHSRVRGLQVPHLTYPCMDVTPAEISDIHTNLNHRPLPFPQWSDTWCWQLLHQVYLKTSAIIYSIVETAKANNLKPFDYVQYLLEEIPKHMNDTDHSFIKDILPWSENLPAGIRKS